MKTIYIFDIDGCIMPEFFPTLSNNKELTDEELKNINIKGYDINFHDCFLKYWINTIKNLDDVYFITGRQRSKFGKLTYNQLYILFMSGTFNYNSPQVIFYPENGQYTKKYYYNWKFNTILNLINKESKILIFDDNNGYFKELENLERYDITCHEMKSNNDWRRLLNEK